MIMENKKIFSEVRKGDIYLANLPEIKDSKIQYGVRPVIITSNMLAAKYSPVVQCVPITSQIKREDLPIHVVLEDETLFKPSMALVEQEGLIDKTRLFKYIGRLSENDIAKIDLAILSQRGIDVIKLARNIQQYAFA